MDWQDALGPQIAVICCDLYCCHEDQSITAQGLRGASGFGRLSLNLAFLSEAVKIIWGWWGEQNLTPGAHKKGKHTHNLQHVRIPPRVLMNGKSQQVRGTEEEIPSRQAPGQINRHKKTSEGQSLVLHFIILIVACSTLFLCCFPSVSLNVFLLTFLLPLSWCFSSLLSLFFSLIVYMPQQNLSRNIKIALWLQYIFQVNEYNKYK